jgi:hypothetical protein
MNNSKCQITGKRCSIKLICNDCPVKKESDKNKGVKKNV